jgi:phage terminase large subunit
MDKSFSFRDTQATKKIFDLSKRIRAVCGGTSASKTISILVWLIDYAQSRKNKKIDIMSESYPHLKDGAMRDFKAIMIDRGYWKDSCWNETDHVYKFETQSIIKFISIDKLGKAHGPRRDVLFINEANNIPFPIFEQLEVRTKEVVWLDWNPSEEFWYYDKIKGQVEHDFLTLTYLDCLDVLDPRIVQSIESKKNNKNWWLVYGLGQLGEVEGRIYKGWQIIDEIPFEARLERYGLDFGYSNDPTSIVAVYKYNGSFIVDEITYQKGLSNKQIADILSIQSKALVIADSAEPKSIDEIASYGILIQPSQKGQGSVLQGIQYVQDQKISITQRSINGLKEYRNYMWQTNKDGKIINEPEPGWDHFNDALRYALESLKPNDDTTLDSINYGLKTKWRL